MQPAALELALPTLQEMEARDSVPVADATDTHSMMQHSPSGAIRDRPTLRMVVVTLEQLWNAALVELEKLKQKYAEFARQKARGATSEQKAEILSIARNPPQMWQTPTNQTKDRK